MPRVELDDLRDYQVWMYYVPNPNKTLNMYEEIIEWMDSITTSRWSSMGFTNVGSMFFIVDDEVAMLFRLRWPVSMTKHWSQYPGERK